MSAPSLTCFAYSRTNSNLLHADFSIPESFRPGGDVGAPGIWISYGPIWQLAPFLERLAKDFPQQLQGLRGLIACSSSSAITKRFSANRYDRELVDRLTHAENQLIATCRRLDIPCRILRPTLIYGCVASYMDSNLSRVLQLMRRSPFVPLPAHTGLRQPIHARQLAEVTLELVRQLIDCGWEPSLPMRIALGGDSTLSYASMLRVFRRLFPLMIELVVVVCYRSPIRCFFC